MHTLYSYTFVLLFLMILFHANAQQYAIGIRVTKYENNVSPRSYVCSRGGTQCADCTTMIVCASGLSNPLETIVCRQPTPHCANNACQANATSECIFEPYFTCTSVGVFPDIYNCSRYRVCYMNDYYSEQVDIFVSELYECPAGYIFNSRLYLCERGTPQSCGRIDCSRSSGKMVLYPPNVAYYAFCLDNREPMMFKCDFDQFETFNLTAGECRFNCKVKGNFQNPANCQEYYYCNAANVMAELISCPNNYIFDGIGCTPDSSKCQYPPPPSNNNQFTTTSRAPAPFDSEKVFSSNFP